jgi:hypothetical protein
MPQYKVTLVERAISDTSDLEAHGACRTLLAFLEE